MGNLNRYKSDLDAAEATLAAAEIRRGIAEQRARESCKVDRCRAELATDVGFPFRSDAEIEGEMRWLRSRGLKPGDVSDRLSARFTGPGLALPRESDEVSGILRFLDLYRDYAGPETSSTKVPLYEVQRASREALKHYEDYLGSRGVSASALETYIAQQVAAATAEEQREVRMAEQAVEQARERLRIEQDDERKKALLHQSMQSACKDVEVDSDDKDRVREAIRLRQLTRDNVSAKRLRDYGAQCGQHAALGRGQAVLGAPYELDQYLMSYGKLTMKGLRHPMRLACSLLEGGGSVRIIDYGCGQGLSTCCVLDGIREWNQGKSRHLGVSEVVLVEPSTVALARAREVVGLYGFPVRAIPKRLAEVEESDLAVSEVLSDPLEGPASTDFCVFSQVLDVEGVRGGASAGDMVQKLVNRGRSRVVMVLSHVRNAYGGEQPSEFVSSWKQQKPIFRAEGRLEMQLSDKLNPSNFHFFVCRFEV